MGTSVGDLKEKNVPQVKAVFLISSATCTWECYGEKKNISLTEMGIEMWIRIKLHLWVKFLQFYKAGSAWEMTIV